MKRIMRWMGAVLGLGLLLVAVALALWVAQGRSLHDLASLLAPAERGDDTVSEQLAALAISLEDSRLDVAREAAASSERLAQTRDELVRWNRALQDQVGDLTARLDSLEQQLADHMERWLSQDVSMPMPEGAVLHRMALVEVAAMLSLAQQRYEWFDDQVGAQALMANAASRVQALDDPSLGAVLRQIQREQAALASAPQIDWGLWQARVVQLVEWSLQSPATQAGPLSAPVAEGEAGDWRERWRRGVGELVTVRPVDEAQGAVIDTALRQQQLQAWLNATLLALYQEDVTQVRARASQTLLLWPTSALGHAEAVEWLNGLSQLQTPTERPVLGGALQQLRRRLDTTP